MGEFHFDNCTLKGNNIGDYGVIINSCKRIADMESIPEETYEQLEGLLKSMVQQKSVPFEKRLELEGILKNEADREGKWMKIRNFLSDAANIAAVTTAFPAIAREIGKLFQFIR